MNPKLSVIVPGIRPHNWLRLYNSIEESFNQDFEVVFISPISILPEPLREKSNIKLVTDFGSPSRCMQIGLINCSAPHLTWAADDGWFLPNKLTECFEFLQEKATSYKDIVTCKYKEGSGKDMEEDWYYNVTTPPAYKNLTIDDDFLILNVGIVDRQYMLALGGWDAVNFEVAVMSYTDFAVRAQNDGAKFWLFDKIFECEHMYCTTGDHAPIHYAQVLNDEPKFRQIYSGTQEELNNRIKIPLDNWKLSPEKWVRRFA